ncbi:MAG TPA: hypothetical protein VK358_18210 [Longimicrobium sp.]|nr:hypothetical protein [Longimicrobium sp.]
MRRTLLVVFAVALGSSLVSYRVALTLLTLSLYLGACSMIAALVMGMLHLAGRALPPLRTLIGGFSWIELGIVIAILGILAAGAIARFDSAGGRPRYGATVHAATYRLHLEPVGEHTFVLKEQFVLRPDDRGIFRSDTLRLPPRPLESRTASLLLRTLRVELSCGRALPSTAVGGAFAPNAAAYRFVQVVCPDSATVRVGPFPRDMFYEATSTDSVARKGFTDTEVVTWSIDPTNGEVSFAYLKSPLHWVRPFLPEAIWVHSLARTILLLIGAIGTCVIVPVLIQAYVSRLTARLGASGRAGPQA